MKKEIEITVKELGVERVYRSTATVRPDNGYPLSLTVKTEWDRQVVEIDGMEFRILAPKSARHGEIVQASLLDLSI